MTRHDHLLVIAEEECMEVAQRISKALRFGLSEVQTGQTLNNAERIMSEFHDLRAMIAWLHEEGLIDATPSPEAEAAKRAKVEEFLRLSEREGRLS